jgi:hypothetical protein
MSNVGTCRSNKNKRHEESMKTIVFPLILSTLVVGSVAAQSARPRKDIPAIAKAANGAIVSIVMSDKDGHRIAQGTGFLTSKDGQIVTNYHVIENGSSAIAKLPDGAFYVVDGVLASDKARDVAVIKVHGEHFHMLALGNSDQVQVGQEVVAIGNPLSLESTVSNGIVSGIRTAEEIGGKFLQVTTPISPGSSGGPLFNMAGEVVGITSLYLEGGENLNFAIPINDAKRLLSAKSTSLRALPNEPESVTAAARAEDRPSSASIDQKTACENLVEKTNRWTVPDRGFPTKTSSHFDPKSSICLEIQIQDERQIKDSDGKKIGGFNIYITDAVDGTVYAKYESYRYESPTRPGIESYYGQAWVRDTKGKTLFPENEHYNLMVMEQFHDLVLTTFGIDF